ncbi:hypothetical protein [Lysinibacillus sp. G4S2]|uniref:hypothetical protein n=1 Tax=Lysinibacillus sp. G4S2 TaxID=3055859 RepID=UPI0025A26654|nr:hypothetical protein [Lysinibacillus sp. G4S2]MDM5248720.1 hypothetical protein [Lysinibacillus sp. G4S2]
MSFQTGIRVMKYEATLDGMKVNIPEHLMNDKSMRFAENVRNQYTAKLEELARFCVEFEHVYPEATIEDVMKKLHLPILKVDEVGERFTYTQNELDEDHLIDIEFVGVMESFISVEVDG